MATAAPRSTANRKQKHKVIFKFIVSDRNTFLAYCDNDKEDDND